MTGIESMAVAPMFAVSGWVGTARQPMRRCPREATISSTVRRHNSRSASSWGRKKTPAEKVPGAPSSAPNSSAATRRSSACGSAVSMPAPSPVFGSQPQAPRWSIWVSM